MPPGFRGHRSRVEPIIGVPTPLVTVALVVPPLFGKPSAEVSWVQPMILAIVVLIVANVLGNAVAAASNPGEAARNDQRDSARCAPSASPPGSQTYRSRPAVRD